MITVAIIEDHQILIDALELMLQSNQEFQFVGAACTLKGGYELVRRCRPAILLLDIRLPDGNGYDLVPEVLEVSPETHVVVLTSYTDQETVMRAVDLGISGFLPKSSSLSEFFTCIRKAAQGEIVMPPALLVGLLKRVPRDRSVINQKDGVWNHLTSREIEVLIRLASGKSGEDIADELSIAPLTVRTHVRNLLSKLGVHSRLEAVAFGVKHGLIDAFG